MDKRIFVLFALALVLVPMVSAIDNIGTFRQGDTIELMQVCDSCTYVNLSSVILPNGTVEKYNAAMTKSNYDYTIDYDVEDIGIYTYSVCGDKSGTLRCESFNFEVTAFGDKINESQGMVLIAEGILIALFFGMARVFDKKKWKIKMGFDVIALLMGIVLTNSIRIVASQAANLTKMGEAMFIGIIAIFSLMIAYMLIMMTIEVVQYFKKKNRDRWEMDTNAY